MRRNVLLFILSLIFVTCTPIKESMIQKGDENDAIRNAIIDFSKKCRLFKNENVFFIDLVKPKTRNIIIVSISRNNSKLILSTKNKIGNTGQFPSRFTEKDGRLFFWIDENYPLTKEAIEIFDKYELLQDAEHRNVNLPDTYIDDSQKGVDYYFCKNNLTKYKRVITNIAFGYYKPPLLQCDD